MAQKTTRYAGGQQMVIPIKKSQSGLYNRAAQATIYKKESDFFVQQSKCIGTYEMDVQVPYRIYT